MANSFCLNPQYEALGVFQFKQKNALTEVNAFVRN